MSDQLVKFVFEDATKGGGGTAAPPPVAAGGGASRQQNEDVTRARQEHVTRQSGGRPAADRTAPGGAAERSRTERAMQDSQSIKAVRLASESFGKLWVRFSDALQANLIRKVDDYANRFGLDKFFGNLAKKFKDYFDALGNPNGRRSGGPTASGGRTTVVDSFVRGYNKARGGGFATENKSPAAGGRTGGGGAFTPQEIQELAEKYGLSPDAISKLGGRASPRAPDPNVIDSTSRTISRIPAGEPAAGGATASRALIPAGETAVGGTVAASEAGTVGSVAAGGEAAAGGLAAAGPIGWAILAALGVVVVTIGAAVVAVKALTAINHALKVRFAEVSERLKPFSGYIQAADARAGVAKLRQDIEFAGRLGGRVGRFNEAEARIERAIDRIGNTINGPLLNIVLPFIERAAAIVEGGAEAFDAITTIADNMGLLKSPLAELVKLQNQMLGIQRDEANKLPPEADVLGAFNAEPYLTVNWRGRTFGADEDREVGGADKKFYAKPLPTVGIP